MKKIGQKGFTFVEGLLIVIALSVVVGLGYYVNSTNKDEKKPEKMTQANDQKQIEATKTPEETQYLTIKEWGVKIPLTDVTKNSTYRIENGYVYLDVAIEDDTLNECKGQAGITKVSNLNENPYNVPYNPSELEKVGSKVNDVYYFISGSQATCSENTKVQEQATAIRTEWLKQSKSIIAQ